MKIFMHPIAAAQMTPSAIGTKVSKPMALHSAIMMALESYEMPENGQGFVSLPEESWSCVLPGVARRTANPEDYCNRLHRGKVGQFLDRSKVELPAIETLAVIVYTAEAFLNDPQTSDEEREEFLDSDSTHCWVTTLAMAGPKAPVGAERFVANLAGGNAAYAEKSAEELIAEALEIETYWSEWAVVA